MNSGSRSIVNPSSSLFSCEQGPEGQNNVVNQINHLLERFEQRLTLANLRLSERYIKSELHLLIEFRIGDIDEKCVTCFEREGSRSLIFETHEGETCRNGFNCH